ncbi:MAG: ATP-dependent DNA helicase RecG [Phycisphaerae bacterium]|jgi:ATP-dependent DNA helicase RecG
MATLYSDSPLQYIKGVGPARAAALGSLGLNTVGDLLEYFPFRFVQECGEVEIADLVAGMNATVQGSVVRLRGGRGGGASAEIDDGTGTCVLRWFQRPYAAKQLRVGVTVIASGKTQEYQDRIELVQPRVQVFDEDTVVLPQGRGARQVGVYRANARVSSFVIRRVVQEVLAQPSLPVAEFLPEGLRSRHELPTREQAVRQMHAPENEAALGKARARLAYEEFLLLELAMALRRRRSQELEAGQALSVSAEVDRRIRARFPFALTAAQDEVVGEIAADLASGRPMTRLLQGDVGSGKTVVALYACLVAVAHRRQAAIMAPTEILAQQHYANIARYLAGSRVRSVLLSGQAGRRQRQENLAAIEAGELDLVVGTQALIQQDVVFDRLAMVVVDEQHKFGVVQRATFRTKGPSPHYLVMTATPIPRTLAMTVFGDLDVSCLRASPPGRGRIDTRVVPARQWPAVMREVRARLERGEQAYVVCPTIGDGETTATDEVAAGSAAGRGKLLSAVEAHERLTSGPWQGLRVALLHGAMKSAEKEEVVGDFSAGRVQALVATTVVEVGVDVANATIMIVEHAERFGLSQLHQLRGRIGRGPRDSLCVLVTRAGGRGKAAERLAVMTETTDGFRIAEADLRQRGPGELFGTRQHGLPELRFGDAIRDFALLEQARTDAFDIVRRDPTLREAEHRLLLPELKRLYGDKLALIDAA